MQFSNCMGYLFNKLSRMSKISKLKSLPIDFGSLAMPPPLKLNHFRWMRFPILFGSSFILCSPLKSDKGNNFLPCIKEFNTLIHGIAISETNQRSEVWNIWTLECIIVDKMLVKGSQRELITGVVRLVFLYKSL